MSNNWRNDKTYQCAGEKDWYFMFNHVECGPFKTRKLAFEAMDNIHKKFIEMIKPFTEEDAKELANADYREWFFN